MSTGEKFVQMFLAIGAVPGGDGRRPGHRRPGPVQARRSPADRWPSFCPPPLMIALGLLYPGDPHHLRVVPRRQRHEVRRAGQLPDDLHRHRPADGAAQHRVWVLITPFVATVHRAALRDPRRPDPHREVRQGADLPADGDLPGRRLGHLEVRLRLPPHRERADRPAQPDPQVLGLDTYRFLLDEPWNTLFLIVIMIWIQAGFAMTILSAAIKAIPDDIVEAARLDGVSASDVPLRHPADHPAGR